MDEHQDGVMTMTQTDLTQLVQRGMTGDRTVLPAIRQLLDTRPALWRELDSLTAQVEQAWMALLAGPDLVAQEILVRQLQTLKHELEGPVADPTRTAPRRADRGLLAPGPACRPRRDAPRPAVCDMGPAAAGSAAGTVAGGSQGPGPGPEAAQAWSHGAGQYCTASQGRIGAPIR